MEQITGWKKYIYLLKALNKEMLGLPLGFVLFMIKQMSFEKFSFHDNQVFINTIYTPFPSPSYRTALKCFGKLSKGIMSPFSVHISVTDRCHLECWHCSNTTDEAANDLAYEDLSRIICELQDAGVSCIGFTGGEPALRRDLENLISSIDNRSFSILFTTGYTIDEVRAKRLKQVGLTTIVVSLDSHIKEEHNEKRNSGTAFDDAILAIKNSLQAGIYTAISTVITKEMLYSDKIYEFVRYVASLGVHEIRILEPKPCGKLVNGNFENFTEEDRKQIRHLQYTVNKDKTLPKIMALAHINSSENYGCNAGRTHIYINARGEVFPCDFSPLSFGNLLDESFSKIYQRMNSYFPKPLNGCIISSISKYFKEANIDKFPIRDKEKIEYLLSRLDKRPIPKLFSKLGFKEE